MTRFFRLALVVAAVTLPIAACSSSSITEPKAKISHDTDPDSAPKFETVPWG